MTIASGFGERDLCGYLMDVARVARSPDREAHPGVAEQFRLPRRRSRRRV